MLEKHNLRGRGRINKTAGRFSRRLCIPQVTVKELGIEVGTFYETEVVGKDSFVVRLIRPNRQKEV